MPACARTQGKAPGGSTIERFRTDAKAEGELVTVGGYQTFRDDGTAIPHEDATWFYLKLDRSSAPWAFVQPFRAIASLELMGTMLGMT